MKPTKYRIWNKEQECFENDGENASYFLVPDGTLWAFPAGDDGWSQVDDVYEAVFFTGKTDKNGKEIYDGDILQGKGDKNRAVYFEEGCFMLYAGMELKHCVTSGRGRKVIGNIYENPELLKESK